jgi:hypothetical protein
MISFVYNQNNDIGVSGLPIIGNETALNDSTRLKVRDELLSDHFAHMTFCRNIFPILSSHY